MSYKATGGNRKRPAGGVLRPAPPRRRLGAGGRFDARQLERDMHGKAKQNPPTDKMVNNLVELLRSKIELADKLLADVDDLANAAVRKTALDVEKSRQTFPSWMTDQAKLAVAKFGVLYKLAHSKNHKMNSQSVRSDAISGGVAALKNAIYGKCAGSKQQKAYANFVVKLREELGAARVAFGATV
jgi:hypothetical protein